MKRSIIAVFSAFCLGIPLMAQTPGAPEEASVLAVMPFSTTGDSSQGPLGESFSDSLTSKLVGLKGLKVFERAQLGKITSELSLQRDAADLFNADTLVSKGAVIAVDYMVVGRVTLAGNQVQVSLRLVRVRDGQAILSRILDGTYPQGFFQLQDTMAMAVVQALKIQLTDLEKRRISRQATQDLQAFELYNMSLGNKTIAERIPLLKRALNRDPSFTQAAHLLADLYNETGDKKAALETYRNIIIQDAQDFRALYNGALLSLDLGLVEEGRKSMETCSTIKPDDPDVNFHLGLFWEFGSDGQKFTSGSSLPQAYTLYKKVLGRSPDHAGALEAGGLLAAVLAQEEKDPKVQLTYLKESTSHLERWLKLYSEDLNAVNIQQSYDQILGARTSLESYLKQNP